MIRRSVQLPSMITLLSVLAVGLALVACQFQPHSYSRSFGWPCAWLAVWQGKGRFFTEWHQVGLVINVIWGVIIIASTYLASESMLSRSKTRSHIRLGSFFVWMTFLAVLFSFWNPDAPPEWLERLVLYPLAFVIPLLFGVGCVACVAWSLIERAVLRFVSWDDASA